jgi:hypothetical protein
MSTPGMALDLDPTVPEATREELAAAFDHTATRYLGISGDEFLRRFDADEIPDMNDLGVRKVLRRIDLVRPARIR